MSIRSVAKIITLALFFSCWFLVAVHAAAQQQPAVTTIPQSTPPEPPKIHFVDIAAQAGLTARTQYGGDRIKKYIIESTGTGAAVIDYDKDGWPDIFLVNGSTLEGFAKGQAPTSHLYHNNRDGTFSDVTQKSGLAHEDTRWSTGCSFVDYDRDGHLDLFVARYVDFDPAQLHDPTGASACDWKGQPVFCGPMGLKGARS